MNGDVLEELVLSGALFNQGDSSPRRQDSPSSSRAASPDPFPVSAQYDSDDEHARSSFIGNTQHHPPTASEPQHESIGLGPGRTGVKGVIRDRAEARERDLERIRGEMEEVAARQGKMDFSAPTYFEELDRGGAEAGGREGDAWGGIEEWRRRRLMELKAGGSTTGGGVVFGHLREVGVGGYVDAVENVPKDVWVVLHIYDASLGRCTVLDAHLSSLARLYPKVKFLRARAGAIGFATSSSGGAPSSSSASKPRTRTRVQTNARAYRDPEESDSDEDSSAARGAFVGAYQHSDEDEEDEEGDDDEPEPDYDVLPTMLVYRGGELAFSWPRVDFEVAQAAGKATGGVGFGKGMEVGDVEALLVKHNIIHPSSSGAAGGGRGASDEEDELEFASDVE